MPLDGEWTVERVGGWLPPLLGVRKRIDGGRGETAIGRLRGVPFDVVGLELRYPGGWFVDVLEPEGDGYAGRALVRGREVGRYRRTRSTKTRRATTPYRSVTRTVNANRPA
jgi:hypothetical protein